MAPTSTPPPATCTAHGVGTFFLPAPVASSSDVGIGTLLGGGDTEYIESIDVGAATAMGADAAPLAGFLGLFLASGSTWRPAGAGQEGRCCGEAWRCAGSGRSGGCGNGLQAIIREGDAAGELLFRDFKPHSISQSVALLFPNLVPKQAADLSRAS